MFNKKIIFALILLSVFVVGLQMAEPVNAVAGKPIDSGSFKVNGKKITYNAESLKNTLYIDFYHNVKFEKYYQLKKVNKNKIKAYQFNMNNGNLKLVKTYTTKKSLKNFYFQNYKKTIVNKVKKDAKKVFPISNS